jgi:hypothetical protein
VYAGTDESLVALALADGSRCWRDTTYNSSYTSGIAIGDGQVFVPSDAAEGPVRVLEAASGAVRQHAGSPETPRLDIGPSLADGALYIAGANRVARFR